METNHKYHSTGQFRNAVRNIQTQASFKGLDGNGEPIIDTLATCPTITYIGTVKLHGTNASIVFHACGHITFHSKNRLLGEINTKGEFTLHSDNSEFAQTMYRRLGALRDLQETVTKDHSPNNDIFPLKVSGEWCGQGVQKGVGISQLTKKGFFIFGIKEGENGWIPVKELPALNYLHGDGIYSMMDFLLFELSIDFNSPELVQNTLIEITKSVEEACPVSVQLGMVDREGKPSLLGEGLVWTPDDKTLVKDTGTWFKTKGEKHSVTKVKKLVEVDIAKLETIEKFVEYAATNNRFEQGLTEVGLDQKKVGEFIGWVTRDINKEEGDTLESNKLSMKDVGKSISTKARTFYLTKLNGV